MCRGDEYGGNIHTCALRAWCGWLTAQGYLNTNPATHLHLVRTTTPDAPSGLDNTAVNALLRESPRSRHSARDDARVQVMLQTGIRIGECAALCGRDITFGEKSGSLLVRAGKGDKARTVPLNGSARTALSGLAPRPHIDRSELSISLHWDIGTPSRWQVLNSDLQPHCDGAKP